MSRSSISLFALFVTCAIATIGCDDAESDPTADAADTASEADTASATDTADDLTDPGVAPGAFAADFETSGDFFTLMAGPVDGTSPHGRQHTWYSTNLRAPIEGGDAFAAPEGAVSIKWFENTDMTGYAVMVKREADFFADGGDWLYEMRTLDGELMMDPMGNPMSGPIAMCADCHQAAASTDFLAATTIR